MWWCDVGEHVTLPRTAAASHPQLSCLQLAGKAKNSMIRDPRQVLLQLCFLTPIPTASAAKSSFIIMKFWGLTENNAASASRAGCNFLCQNELLGCIARTVPRVTWIHRTLLHFLMGEQSQQPGRSRANQELGFQGSWMIWFTYAPWNRHTAVLISLV